MKDLKIEGTSIIRELLMWGLFFIIAFLTNVFAISFYEGQWSELYSQLHIVFILSIVYYFVALLIRGLISGIKAWINRGRSSA